MVRLFKHYIPHAVLLLGLADFALLLLAGDLAWDLRASQVGMAPGSFLARLPLLLAFAMVTQGALIAVGVFGAEALRSMRFAGARLLVGVSLAVLAFAWFYLQRAKARDESSGDTADTATPAMAASTPSGEASYAQSTTDASHEHDHDEHDEHADHAH